MIPTPSHHMTATELAAHEAAVVADEERDMPDAAEIAETIQMILDPACDAEERQELVHNLEAYGRVSLSSYREAGALTRNKGFYLRIGAIRFAVSVHD